jgi:thiol-disulfide isomerase/thioredoxin
MKIVILRFFAVCALLLAGLAVMAEPIKLESLEVGSKVYRNVTVLGANATDLYFTHAEGIANVKLKYLSPDLQKRFHYDSTAAADAEQQQTKGDSLYYDSVAAKLAAQSHQAAVTPGKTFSTSVESLSDPLSEKSLLGKTGPALDSAQWQGEKPVLTNRFVLIYFWAPWSIPCRKYIPEFNALQKKLADRLSIVALATEAAADQEPAEGPAIEFASGVDTGSKISAAAGVTSVPCVLLEDQKGTVRYLGHPSAINEKTLQPILAKSAE